MAEATPGLRRCTKCRETKPLGEFGRQAAKPDGLHCWCRECLRAAARAAYDPNAARARYEAKKHDPEYRAKRKATYDKWRAEHPDRATQATLRWRERRAEHVAAVRSEWGKRSEDRRLKRRGYHRARRVRMSGANVDYAAILAEHGMTCHICGGSIATQSELHFDHVVPLAVGGLHSHDNIRPAHAACNMAKGARC